MRAAAFRLLQNISGAVLEQNSPDVLQWDAFNKKKEWENGDNPMKTIFNTNTRVFYSWWKKRGKQNKGHQKELVLSMN